MLACVLLVTREHPPCASRLSLLSLGRARLHRLEVEALARSLRRLRFAGGLDERAVAFAVSALGGAHDHVLSEHLLRYLLRRRAGRLGARAHRHALAVVLESRFVLYCAISGSSFLSG